MNIIAVVKTGGKQYLVKQDQELIVNKIPAEAKDKKELETLLTFDIDSNEVELGTTKKVTAEVVEQLKGEKIRVAKFKSKVRYRKVRGFRPHLTKVKIASIA